MKGYLTGEGFMGYVGGKYILFVSESEYQDFAEGEYQEYSDREAG